MLALEAERDALRAELAALEAEAADVVEFHPAAIDAYRATVDDLQAALQADPQARAEAAAILRPLVDRIEIAPLPARGDVTITLHGRIAELLNLPRRNEGRMISTVPMVAEEGFEPPTRGL